MFLRNIARSLSFGATSGKTTSGGKLSRQQQEQQQQQQQQQVQTTDQIQAESPEVGTGSLRANVGASANTSRPRARDQKHPPPKLVADCSHQPQSSAPANSSITIHNNNIHQTLASTDCSVPASSDISLTCTDLPVLVTPSQNFRDSTLTFDCADRDPASNFLPRPLHLETLSPNPGLSQVAATINQHSLLEHSNLQTSPRSRSDRHERSIAMQRKVWVKRPGASATRVEVDEEDLVDNVRDVILRKYANSLGRHIDSPDITLKIVSREQANKNVAQERVLGPEEGIGRTLDTYYPGGQTIEEALVIDVPQKRTPKPSPRPGNHHMPYYVPEDYRPGDGAREYFPPMPMQSPHIPHVQHSAGPNVTIPVHSMSVLATGQIPPLPSPGGQHSRTRHTRPKYPRQHTSSPTILHNTQANGIDGKVQLNNVAAPAQPLPTPPPTAGDKNIIPPPNRTTSPHSSKPNKKKRQAVVARDINGEPPLPTKPASANLLDGRVPPINVLLVEDNVINLKLLEAFMKRLKVRWQSAMNGMEAVNMWRKGGFHLVLMDIQLPVMNGLEATKEIRRLESVNGIGLSIFGEINGDGKCDNNGQLKDEDKLEDRELFKSPVIIVALTASSLQSDRHEALAVGCNDFLTKPVNFVWMERKVTEWGCMQALIDFDGWRRWKAIEEKKASEDPEKRKEEEKEDRAKQRAALTAMIRRPPPSTKKEGSSESATRRDNASTTTSSTSPNTNGSTNESTQSRRNHKGSRSQSGATGTSLGTTIELDEKD